MKLNNKPTDYGKWLYPLSLVVIFLISFNYIFNSKIDLNGDNCSYYMLATSIAQGHGFADITNDAYTPSNVFPPGYPLLMSIVRLFTGSFLAQKIMNGLFLLASSLLMFHFFKKQQIRQSVAVVAAALMLVNFQVLHFATMMMSEMSFLLFSVLSLYALYRSEEKGAPFWKNPFFYLTIFFAAYGYHIRTQGIAMVAAIAGFFLFTRKWKEMLGFIAGFALCLLPWMLRNKILGLGQSRYLDMIAMSNSWRPEEGTLGISEIISRFFDTLQMLVTKAIPNSMVPYLNVNYNAPTTLLEWLVGIIILLLFTYGAQQLNRYKYVFWFYILGTLCVISLFSAPSGNRYLTSALPFIETAVFIGLYTLLSVATRRLNIGKQFSPYILAVICLFACMPKLNALHKINSAQFPPNYANFFRIGEEVHKRLPKQTVVCSRKPELFYMFSKGAVCGYQWTEDDRTLIKGLLDSKADYVVLEQLGFSSTVRYLYPAINKHPELFRVVIHLKNPDTYLLQFDREKAAKMLSQDAG